MWEGEARIRYISTRSVCIEFSQSQLLILGDRMILSFWYRKDIFHIGISCPVHVLILRKKKEGQSGLLVFAVFQMPLTQNSQYATTADFRVAYSEILWDHISNTHSAVSIWISKMHLQFIMSVTKCFTFRFPDMCHSLLPRVRGWQLIPVVQSKDLISLFS